MAELKPKDEWQRADDEVRKNLPPGVKLVRTLRGHTKDIGRIAWSPDGRILASPSEDKTIRLWDTETGKCLRILKEDNSGVHCVAIDTMGRNLAYDNYYNLGGNSINLRELATGKLLGVCSEIKDSILSIDFAPDGDTLAIGSSSIKVELRPLNHPSKFLSMRKASRYLEGCPSSAVAVAFDKSGERLAAGSFRVILQWDARSGKMLRKFKTDNWTVSLAFTKDNKILASAGFDKVVRLWDWNGGRLIRTFEGHTNIVRSVSFLSDGRLIASMGDDQICIWKTESGERIAIINGITRKRKSQLPGLAFHPSRPILAIVGAEPVAFGVVSDCVVYIFELDIAALLGQAAAEPAVHHTTAKIVLVGDHSVGKSGLGYRMIHGKFKEQASTHGQQFWVFPALGKVRADGTQCEAILWDLAGQPDYRLVHALFVDDADLALLLFDAADIRDPLHGVEFWLKQLKCKENRCPIILVGAQSDRGNCTLTPEELEAFCRQQGLAGPVRTSALKGEGIAELMEQMKTLIPWDDKPATVTTTTFKLIKDYVLGLKETESGDRSIVSPEELRSRLEATVSGWQFTDAEMLTAVGHLENYGYVKRLRTSTADTRILLEPERLNNLASSFVLEARRNPKGLGSLEEKRLLARGYPFPELIDLSPQDAATLLDSATLLFLDHNVAFRETDPLRIEPFLVFPELINLKKPVVEEKPTVDGVAYTVSGAVENVFASLVVLLGYTNTFTRTNQWQNNARYEVGDGLVCGFRQEEERGGELDFVLYFCSNVGQPVRTLFQGLFESFLARRNLTVMRYEPVKCTNTECGHLLDRSVVRQRMKEEKTFAFCNDCGKKLLLPKMEEPIQLTHEEQAQVEAQRRIADQRTRFEQAIFSVQTYAVGQKIKAPECFISYAWGVPEHERWVEKRLATDLQKAGIDVLLDRWHNAQIGASVARFVERIEECGRVIVVGTPLYRQKAKNVVSAKGSVVAAEWDLAGIRMLATEDEKRTVLPVLLAGEESESFPPLLRGRVYGDFRKEETYFTTAFDLILSIYKLPPNHPALADLRESLQRVEFR